MQPDPQSVYYLEYMKVPEDDRLNLDQSWYARIEYYASDAGHADPKHKDHETPSRRMVKKKKLRGLDL